MLSPWQHPQNGCHGNPDSQWGKRDVSAQEPKPAAHTRVGRETPSGGRGGGRTFTLGWSRRPVILDQRSPAAGGSGGRWGELLLPEGFILPGFPARPTARKAKPASRHVSPLWVLQGPRRGGIRTGPDPRAPKDLPRSPEPGVQGCGAVPRRDLHRVPQRTSTPGFPLPQPASGSMALSLLRD